MSNISHKIFEYIMINKLDSSDNSNSEKWYVKLLGDQKTNVIKKAKFLTQKFISDNSKQDIFINYVKKKNVNFKIATTKRD